MRVKDGFVIREVLGQAVVIPTGKASKEFSGMVKLNDTGKEIWESIAAGISVEEIATKISETYEVSKEAAEADVRKFIFNMEERGFLEE